MNDPHVVALRYKLCTGQSVIYDSPPAVTHSDPSFDATLVGGILTIELKEHHATIGSAQTRVCSFLRAWEINSAIDFGRDALRFEFDGADVIDRIPPLPGRPAIHSLSGSASLSISGTATLQVIRHAYPTPPPNFAASPLVELLWARYEEFEDGKDLLTTMGYACLSAVQSQAGGRNKVVTQFNIHIDVLNQLGRLTSDVGDELTARKFDALSTRRSHTEIEKTWIVAAIKLLILRVAEHDSDPSAVTAQITLADLPIC